MSRIAAFFLFSFVLIGPSVAQVRLVVDSSSLDFGGLSLVSTKDLTIQISDTTTSDFIQIDKITPSGAAAGDFRVTSPQSFPIVLIPGNHPQPVIIRFGPKLLGNRLADLVIQTSDGQLSIPMQGKGTGEQSDLELSLTSIDFGTIAPNTARDTIVYLRSLGPDSATVTGLQMANSGNDVFFDATLLDTKLQFPFKVAAGDSLAIDIRFNGIVPEDEKDGSLTIFGNASSPPGCSLLGFVHYGSFSLSLPTVNFGPMYDGEVKDSTLSIRNDGAVDISVDAIQSVAEDFSLLNPPQVPFMIPAGKSVDLTIRANPQYTLLPDWQVQINSFSSIPALRQTALHVDTLPMPLKAPVLQQASYICADPAPVTVSIPITNTGVRAYRISSILSNDGAVTLTPDAAMPFAIAPGTTQTLGVQFDPNLVAHDTLIIAFFGGDKAIMHDTIVLVPTPIVAEVHSSELAVLSDSSTAVVELRTLTTLPQKMTQLVEHIAVSDSDVATIDPKSFLLDPSITSGTLTVTSDSRGGYVATVNSALPFTLSSGAVILRYKLDRFVARSHSTTIVSNLQSPEYSECVSFLSDTSSISGWSGCGAPSVSDAMRGVPLLFSIHVAQNPVSGDQLHLEFDASEALSAAVSVRDELGRALRDDVLAIQKGSHEVLLTLGTLHANTYYLTVTTADGARHIERFVKN